jgi:hypothetical protein
VRAVGVVDDGRLAALDAATAGHRTLEHVVRWVAAEGHELAEVVTMDEFTHDVVILVPEGLFLVFDTT